MAGKPHPSPVAVTVCPRAAALASAIVLAGCIPTPLRSEEPAVITAPTPASRQELARVVSGALHGAPVRLADDALTKESVLLVERARPRGANGAPLDGRVMEKPEQFELLKRGGQCILVHRRAGERYPLTQATCAPSRK